MVEKMIRHGQAPFLECSTKGDKRLSAFCAIVNGKSIEAQYQAAKVFSNGVTGLPPQAAKGKHFVNVKECAELYSRLWDEYIRHNPELLYTILNATGLSDIFGQPFHVCQATELWRIRQDYLYPVSLVPPVSTNGETAPESEMPKSCPDGCGFTNGWQSFLLCANPWHNTPRAISVRTHDELAEAVAQLTRKVCQCDVPNGGLNPVNEKCTICGGAV
jgi:hypothetical protein